METCKRTNTDSITWACLWLADPSRLQSLVSDAEAGKASIVSRAVFNKDDNVQMARAWVGRARTSGQDLTPKKRPAEAYELSPSKIPHLVRGSVSSGTASPAQPVGSGCVTRSVVANKDCRRRDQESCVVTKAGEPLEIAHIYSYSMGRRKNSQAQVDFWNTLKCFWSQEQVAAWEVAVLGPEGTETVKNLICLSSHVHALWAKARFAFKPLEMDADKKRLKTPAPCFRITSLLARGTKLFNCNTETKICSGDVIEFTTDDPDNLPLPSAALLEMQWIIARVIAISGAADVSDEDFDSFTDWQGPGWYRELEVSDDEEFSEEAHVSKGDWEFPDEEKAPGEAGRTPAFEIPSTDQAEATCPAENEH
ncbi:HNH endonuclease signature motif containing protein [Aspergillus tanneri]|uniref:HNH nuclease domain-containing protein n=1 Tax=Aspergillus tanneri TaxID=1220188 RepID=A0A5M9MSH1_9EURO|nr:uncharacterized protein ATNIH1004_004175 [Aspergillus tanneri]KAA8648290.1 hypothetical protein ATNIH1004_004175 [Aspergillus tanneri]